MCVQVLACMCVYAHICVCAKARGQTQVSFLGCHPPCFETGLTLAGLTLIGCLGWLANAPQDPASVTPCYAQFLFSFYFVFVVFWDLAQFLMLAPQALYQMNHLSKPFF